MEIIEEALKAVETINDVINCNLFEDQFIPEKFVKRLEDVSHNYMLGFSSNGDACVIDFLGQQIWSSEDDDREWDDEKDIPAISVEAHIFHEMMKIMTIDLRLIERALNK